MQRALNCGLSDHCPILLSVDEVNWGPRPRRMLKCWGELPGYKQFVRDSLQSFHIEGWVGYVLKEKLKLIKGNLNTWHQNHTQNLEGRLSNVQDRIAFLDAKGEDDDLLHEEIEELHSLSANFHSLSRINTSMQWQKSRLLWLKEGDANSKFFHSIMSSRRRANPIFSLSVDDTTIEGVEGIRGLVFNYFSSHFRFVAVERPSIENLNFNMLNVGQCGELTKPFSAEEVKQAVWDCNSFKSPGPNGVNMGFVKDFWPELCDDFMRFICDFHRNGKLSKGINSTFISLIPKVECPQRLNDFRPISMVGSLYKVLSKVLSNRLRRVMSSVISETQSAFIHGRQILDGILISNEIVEDAKRLKKDLLLFKVDFEKAFDSIDWSYLDAVMKKMNFPTLWRKWIMECVSTASTSVLVNAAQLMNSNLNGG